MKKIFLVIAFGAFVATAFAQENVSPARENKGVTFIKNATIHTGTGKVLENATIKINNGKIEQIGSDIVVPADAASVVDAKGKHVYPGLILPSSNLGLVEISSVRATADFNEIGDLNPNVRSIIAYNTDSKVINTLRSNGILLANIVPQGNLLAGTSSVVQLDAWNWKDAAYNVDEGMHIYMPTFMPRPTFGRRRGGGPQATDVDPLKADMDKLEMLKDFFSQAKAYLAEPTHQVTNLKFEAASKLFEKKQKLYVHANTVKQMLLALDFKKQYGFDLVIVGGSDSWQIADLLKAHDVSVILQTPHSLPTAEDDNVFQPYKTAAELLKAGVLFTISDDDGQTRGRNLPFNAGTAAAFGLTKEEALQAVTQNAAKILGIADKTGSLEVGKDANIVISDGDILDMRTSQVTDAFIQGRKIDLTDKQKQLNQKFSEKYKVKGF